MNKRPQAARLPQNPPGENTSRGPARKLRRLFCAASLTALGLASAACGKNTALSVKILTAPNADPFASASTARLTLQGNMMTPQQTTAMVSGGKFSVQLEISPPMRDHYVYLTVEALDGAGQVLGRGRTPLFFLPQEDLQLQVYVGRPGQVTATSVFLPDDVNQEVPVGRKYLAGASLRGRRAAPDSEPGIGALIVGGVGESQQLLAKAWLYSPGQHQLFSVGTPQAARSGAVLVPSADTNAGNQALLWGGMGEGGKPVTSAEIFDAQAGSASSLFSAPSDDVKDSGMPGAFQPALAEVKDGVFLASGGSSQAMGGMAQAQAVLLQRTAAMGSTAAKLGVSRLPVSMAAARSEHSASPVTLPDGPAAFLFGGLSTADLGKPVAEVFLADKNTFQEVALAMPPPSRRGHASVTLRSGKVLVVGGYEGDAPTMGSALASALVIDPVGKTYQLRDKFLQVPRYAASITLLSKEVLVCGGFGQMGEPLNTCEQFAADDLLMPLGAPITMPRARAGHLALLLETDQLLLVGGVGDFNKPVAEIDLYTAM